MQHYFTKLSRCHLLLQRESKRSNELYRQNGLYVNPPRRVEQISSKTSLDKPILKTTTYNRASLHACPQTACIPTHDKEISSSPQEDLENASQRPKYTSAMQDPHMLSHRENQCSALAGRKFNSSQHVRTVQHQLLHSKPHHQIKARTRFAFPSGRLIRGCAQFAA